MKLALFPRIDSLLQAHHAGQRPMQAGDSTTEGIMQRRILDIITERADTVEAILQKLLLKRVVHLHAPPYTGKTGLCQLIAGAASRRQEGDLQRPSCRLL